MTLSLPIEDGANELLSRSPLALLTGMLLDQQVPLEKAFSSPYELALRLGHEPTAAELADYNPEALAAVFSQRPALHRFPKAMAARVQELARMIVELSARTGRLLRVLHTATVYRATPGNSGTVGQLDQNCNVLSLGPTGVHVLVACFAFGRLDGTRFTPLPGFPSPSSSGISGQQAAAW